MKPRIERMIGEFGPCLFQRSRIICIPDEGLEIQCPQNGYYCVYNIDNGTISEYHSTQTIVEKKKLFEKRRDDRIQIYYISNGSTNCKGFTSKMAFDVSFDNVSTEDNISFDYSIRVATGRIRQFISFVSKENIQNAADGEKYSNILYPDIIKVVREAIGEALRIKSATDVETSSLSISMDIKDKLNSPNSNLYDNGLEVVAFSFNIVESYTHREEKKRIEKNVALKDRL